MSAAPSAPPVSMTTLPPYTYQDPNRANKAVCGKCCLGATAFFVAAAVALIVAGSVILAKNNDCCTTEDGTKYCCRLLLFIKLLINHELNLAYLYAVTQTPVTTTTCMISITTIQAPRKSAMPTAAIGIPAPLY
jgi:hypothetical protein